MDSLRIDELIAVYREGLLEDTLPFWIDHCVDRRHGGFMFSLDRDGTVIDTDKGMWQHGRFAWLLATLYNTWSGATSGWIWPGTASSSFAPTASTPTGGCFSR